MKLLADISKCVGAGQCVMFAEDLFSQDEDTGLVSVLVPNPSPGQRESAERAIIACPSLAIWLEDEAGNRIA